MYETNRPRRKLWPWAAAGAALVIAGAVTMVVLITSGPDRTTLDTSKFGITRGKTELHQASTTCACGDLADKNHTLIIDMTGEDFGSGTVSYTGLLCVLNALDIPTAVLTRMESTRALDGMQSATWTDFEASWTYHPDDGLDVIITQTS